MNNFLFPQYVAYHFPGYRIIFNQIFEEYLNDSFSQVDVSIQCLDADFNPNFIPMEFYDVEAAQFNDGNVTIISQGAILSTINFSQEFNEMHFNQEMQFDEKDFDGPDGYDEFDGPIL